MTMAEAWSLAALPRALLKFGVPRSGMLSCRHPILPALTIGVIGFFGAVTSAKSLGRMSADCLRRPVAPGTRAGDEQGTMSQQRGRPTKYVSEEVWRLSLATQLDNLHRFSGKPSKEVQQIHRRIARIRADGLPEWRERYDAAAQASD